MQDELDEILTTYKLKNMEELFCEYEKAKSEVQVKEDEFKKADIELREAMQAYDVDPDKDIKGQTARAMLTAARKTSDAEFNFLKAQGVYENLSFVLSEVKEILGKVKVFQPVENAAGASVA